MTLQVSKISQSERLLKLFNKLKIKTYPHKSLNTFTGVIRNSTSLIRGNKNKSKKPKCNQHKKNNY